MTFPVVSLWKKVVNKSWVVKISCKQNLWTRVELWTWFGGEKVVVNMSYEFWTNVFKCYQYVWCCSKGLGKTFPIGWVGGWETLKIRVNSGPLQLKFCLSLATILNEIFEMFAYRVARSLIEHISQIFFSVFKSIIMCAWYIVSCRFDTVTYMCDSITHTWFGPNSHFSE